MTVLMFKRDSLFCSFHPRQGDWTSSLMSRRQWTCFNPTWNWSLMRSNPMKRCNLSSRSWLTWPRSVLCHPSSCLSSETSTGRILGWKVLLQRSSCRRKRRERTSSINSGMRWRNWRVPTRTWGSLLLSFMISLTKRKYSHQRSKERRQARTSSIHRLNRASLAIRHSHCNSLSMHQPKKKWFLLKLPPRRTIGSRMRPRKTP